MSSSLDIASVLEHEHRSVEKVIGTISIIVEDLDQGRRIDFSLLNEVIFFLRIFADQCQTAKEDDLLFSALEEKCMSPATCPIESLREDHRRTVFLTLQLAEAADAYAATGAPTAQASLTNALHDLAKLYQHHIWTEDNVVLPLAEKILSSEERDRLVQAFDRVPAQIEPDEVVARIGERARRCACHLGEIVN